MPVTEPADLELSLRRGENGCYAVDAVLRQPNNAAEVQLLPEGPALTRINRQDLDAIWPGAEEYGKVLGAMLLGPPALARALAEARAVSANQSQPLRLRLLIVDAPELHQLRWETIRDPADDLPLATGQRVLFTRTLRSPDWRLILPRARSQLRALVAIAAPRDLERFSLTPIDAEAEHKRAIAGLGPIPAVVLARPGEATLQRLLGELGRGSDILYLLAHGRMVEGHPWLYLDDGAGNTARVSGAELADAIADLPDRPRLVLLASCESAGVNDGETVAALGHRLAVAGIPAVIAMQGAFSAETNATFTPAFFRALAEDGWLDNAVAVARRAVQSREDWWAPVLFSRLRTGRIWYDPGFTEEFTKWPALVTHVRNAKCTAIVGPGLLDAYVGPSRELARRLAVKHGFPLAPFARDDLPQVTQFLAISQDPGWMIDELSAALRETLTRYLGEPVDSGESSAILSAVGRRRRNENADEPYKVLASLPFSIYLLANPDPLLVDALREAGREPQVQTCRWYQDYDSGEVAQEQQIERPSYKKPLVFYLFGTLDEPESLVLTEDQYFQYLMKIAAHQDVLPSVVKGALVNSSLLFMGFRLEDWNFRVIYQTVLNHAGAQRLQHYINVAVQVDPQEEPMVDPEAARKYLVSRFGSASVNKVSIYWGGSDDFLRDLDKRVGSDRGR